MTPDEERFERDGLYCFIGYFVVLGLLGVAVAYDNTHKAPVAPPKPTLEVIYTNQISNASETAEKMAACGKSIKELRPTNKGVPEKVFDMAYQACLKGTGATI